MERDRDDEKICLGILRIIAVTTILKLKISRRDSPEIYNLSAYRKQEIEVGIEKANSRQSKRVGMICSICIPDSARSNLAFAHLATTSNYLARQ